jgi:putative DNA primase/helicase
LKILHPEGKDGGWDAADALAEGMDTNAVIAWARPRVKPYAEVVVQPALPMPPADKISKSSYALWDSMQISKSANGQPVVNMDNVLRVLESDPKYKDKFWFDTFHQKVFTTYDGPGHEISEVDWLRIATEIQRELHLLRFNDETVRKAIIVYSHRFLRSEPKEWLESLKWDGKPRCAGFFALYMGVDESPYSMSASQNWWITMAARILAPGCQVDNMVILEGRQGTFKTSALRVIGGRWYAESHESVISKDFYQVLTGKLLIEIAEMDTFSRAEDSAVKKIVTCTSDRYRESYGRVASDHPRQCVFVGTTNEGNYLRDATGARRFWPVKIGRINLELIKQDRDQLFAEAVHRFKAGETWWVMPVEETVVEQESRRYHDEWEQSVWAYVKDHTSGVTITEVADKALQIDVARLDVMAQRRVTKILKGFGWEFTAERQIYGTPAVRVWRPTCTE